MNITRYVVVSVSTGNLKDTCYKQTQPLVLFIQLTSSQCNSMLVTLNADFSKNISLNQPAHVENSMHT